MYALASALAHYLKRRSTPTLNWNTMDTDADVEAERCNEIMHIELSI